MDQKQFSRQLIVLRAIINGYTGHARLIHCPTGQELEVRVQTPAGMRALYAVVVERCAQGYRGCPLGALAVDERGQATGAFSLDNPGVTPEILAIVEQTEDDCLLAMSGFLSGARDVNWAGVRGAACDAVSTNACTDCISLIQPRDDDASAATELPSEAAGDADSVESREAPAGVAESEAEQQGESVPTPISESQPDEADSAEQAAGIDADCDWPEEIAALKALFRSQRPVTPFPGSRYTFISVPASGEQPAFFAGIWASDGYPQRAAYAIRGDSPATQPQGLECFLWRAAADGGFWVAYVDALTGQPVSGDF
ncbi:MAG: hypothetical protein Q4E13_11120 [Clostridia bacterium]|nr:hypothetical protein [Clostridia bacterium]